MQEEIAGEDVPRQQIHHLGLPVGGGRAGRRDVLQIEHDDPRRPEIELRRRIERREAADQVGDVALEDLRSPSRSSRRASGCRTCPDLVGAHRADQVLKDRHGVALRALGQPILADVAERVDDVAPVGRRRRAA